MSSLTKSQKLFQRAQKVIPGGVSSPVRAFKAVGGDPIFIDHGEGACIYDVDGNRYLDFCCSWGPLILGHAHSEVLEAVNRAMSKGMTFGTATQLEVELAEYIIGRIPHLEQVRFVSSGTEAVMSAIRLARGFTGRDKIIKFDGCYHGHSDNLLVKAGSGAVTFGTPSSAGVPSDFAKQTLIADLDSEEAVERLFKNHGNDIAAVIIEPIPANNGLLLQRPEFLRFVREIADKYGALLIFDEVISGFRVGWGGAAQRYSIIPDLMTFGKVIGGGMPVGAFAGRQEIMQRLSPVGNVYQAGTLSGNPVAMAAGLATLRILERENGFERLEHLSAAFERALKRTLSGDKVQLARIGSILWIVFQKPIPRRARDIDCEGIRVYNACYRNSLDNGIYLPPSGYEVLFVSLAHREEQLEEAATVISASVRQYS